MSSNPGKPSNSSSSSQPGVLLGVLLAALALVGLVRFGDNWPAIDFYQFWLVGRDVHGRADANPYAADARAELGKQGLAEARMKQGPSREPSLHLRVAEYRQALEVYSTPLLYGTVGSVSVDDYETDKRAWQRCMLGLFALSVLICALSLGMGWGSALLCLAAFSLSSEPLLAELGNGNVNSVLLFSLASAILAWSRGRHAAGAFALGLGLCFKPLLMLALLPIALRWLLAGDRRSLIRAAAGLLAGVVSGLLLGAWLGGGFAMWPQWLSAARELATQGQDYPDNFAPLATIAALLSWPAPPGWFGPVLVLVLAGARAWMRRGVPPGPREACEWLAWGAAMSLVASPLVWIHYLLLAVPLALCVLANGSAWMRVACAVALFCMASQPLTMLLGLREHSARSLPVALALVLLVGLGMLLATPRSGEARAR